MRLPVLPTALLATLALAAPAAAAHAPRIAYESYEGVATVRPDGTGDHVVVQHADAPSWSPDHERFAYVFKNAIWTARADGSDRRRVVRRDGYISDLAVSPNGRRIAYVVALGTPGLGVYDRATRRDRFTPVGDRTAVLDVTWSPDSSRVAWLQHPIWRRAGQAPPTRLYTAKPDGSQQRTQITWDGSDRRPDSVDW